MPDQVAQNIAGSIMPEQLLKTLQAVYCRQNQEITYRHYLINLYLILKILLFR